jgi:hypothetical protein
MSRSRERAEAAAARRADCQQSVNKSCPQSGSKRAFGPASTTVIICSFKYRIDDLSRLLIRQPFCSIGKGAPGGQGIALFSGGAIAQPGGNVID